MNILLWDVETAPIVAAVWGLYNQDIHHDSIIEDWFIICASWKWLHKKKIHSVSLLGDERRFKANHKDDYYVIETLHKILSKADVLVAHNGDAFDLKKFNSRAIYHGFKPIPPPKTVDTLKEARKNFKFTSNRLDYLGQHLGVGKKIDTPKGLWMRALRGVKSAIKTMVVYCNGDIKILEEIYLKLKPWMANHPNYNVYVNEEDQKCPNCGGYDLRQEGHRFTKTGKKKRFSCRSCGKWSSSGKNVEDFVKVEVR